MDERAYRIARNLLQDNRDRTIADKEVLAACAGNPNLAACVQEVLGDIQAGQAAAEQAFGNDAARGDRDATVPQKLGRYELLRYIGAGGFGQVWKAFDPKLRRDVAVKFALADCIHSPDDFLREAQNAAKLAHPNIVTVHDCGREGSHCYIVSHFIEGCHLASIIKDKERHLSPSDAARIIASVADGLAAAHAKGLVHRDVKPSNILIDNEGKPFLADFGIAASRRDLLSVRGASSGTLAYMSPEQIRGDGNQIDPRSDIFSLGAVMYELLARARPFVNKDTQGKDTQYLRRQIKEVDPWLPRSINAQIPEDMEAICLKALAKSPEDRFANAAEFACELRRCIGDSRPKRRIGRGVMTIIASMVVLVACVWLAFKAPISNRSSQPVAPHPVGTEPQDSAAREPVGKDMARRPEQTPVTADDFLPPVLGGRADVANPEAVSVEGNIVSAANIQDAMNAAVAENTKQLGSRDDLYIGAKMIKSPGGFGYVATGAATYRTMENPVASQIAKRKAYVIAFINAKKNLAEVLGGLTNESREMTRKALVSVNLPKEELTNIATETEEALAQVVDMMLRGFVIYDVKDLASQNTVYVSVASTPQTRGELARLAPNALEADDLRNGLNQVITEIRCGLAPPVGCRVVTVRASGATAFVGFGSAVVRSSENAAAQAEFNLSAQKIAAMRAKDSLCGLLSGDHATWSGSVVESLKDENREFDPLREGDPLAQNDSAGVKKLDEARQSFVSEHQTTEVYRSARKGVLPPGVTSRTWFNDDNTWAFGMSVYTQGLSDAAADAVREMRESSVPDQSKDGNPDGFTDEDNPDIRRPHHGSKLGTDDKRDNDDAP